jgi:hypothetical protein
MSASLSGRLAAMGIESGQHSLFFGKEKEFDSPITGAAILTI